ncbi:DUF397 domain-containing protein [Amycolatopsis sp. MEPSY49]|uniref:DUF397 domain-containing protein n=1 Tax=Amycolatopsis sp. MEPSY49 TaxID=3151600 RepID=UPI003EF7ED43
MTEEPPADHVEWFRSSYSSAWGSGPEVRFEPGSALVRDSTDPRPDSPVLKVLAPAWNALLGHLNHEHEHQ